MRSTDWINKWIDKYFPWIKIGTIVIDRIILFSAIIFILLIVYDLGFGLEAQYHKVLPSIYFSYIKFYVMISGIRVILNFINKEKSKKEKWIELLLLILFSVVLVFYSPKTTLSSTDFLHPHFRIFTFLIFFMSFFHAVSKNIANFYNRDFSPTFFLVFTYFILSSLGTIAILLPRSTKEGIGFIDALFTAVSAVSLSGASVVDTAVEFTRFGHMVLLILMQLGGLGIMAFAGLFGKMFTANVSFKNRIILSNAFLNDRMGEVMNIMYKILFITFLVEASGTIGVYFTTLDYPFADLEDRLFFCIYYSVSSFSNTGFTLTEGGMMDPYMESNYSLQLLTSFLFIIGGIGFSVIFIYYARTKNRIIAILMKIFKNKRMERTDRVLNVNVRLILWTTSIIIIVSIIAFAAFEWENSLGHRNLWGKIVGVFYSATAPRGTGGNVVEMTNLTHPTIMLFMLLMWIGASPGGTGGGLRTTTFAVALLNIWSVIKGRSSTVIFGREIEQKSIRRAYATISLSIIMMGFFTFLIFSFDGENLGLQNVVFEVFSSFNNIGMSLVGTEQYTPESKILLTCAMFIGRVNILTLFTAFMYKKEIELIKYPNQDIIF
ncbi:MAG: hypothetical protein M9887_08055 [Chitinophagales bacterium]|nr:hypothetical protein [Chitinophagales bacterium]